MKTRKKYIGLFILLIALSNSIHSQSLLLRMMNGFNDLTECIGKFFTTGNAIDSQINKEKLKNMAAEFHGEILDLIFVKDSIVNVLEHSATNTNPDYKRFIPQLQDKMTALSNSLLKYKDLISATGIDAQNLSYQLKNDFMLKAQTLSEAKNLVNTNASDKEIKQDMIVYFKSCINFLKNAQASLEKFNP